MTYGVFLLLFMYEITLNWIWFGGIDILVFFLRIYSGENATVPFSPPEANIDK